MTAIVLLLSAILGVLVWIALTIRGLRPTPLVADAMKLWKEAFVREIREARLENRKLHRAELPTDRRPD